MISLKEGTRLVIWDLDDTFWKGTLAEGSIEYLRSNHELVIALTQRGIINSICSNNDFDAARAVLETHGIMQYFVFPEIGWAPKSGMIADIIRKTQLLPQHVLFLDDNPRLLREAEFYNPGLFGADPAFLAAADLSSWKPTDPQMRRLDEYKLLERKQQARSVEKLSNDDFLRQSVIRVKLLRDVKANATRVLDLIGRANQLNFTKVRMNEDQLAALIDDPQRENACIQVVDRFGDYGICGFYSLDKANHRLEQFVFSCRILNMGIEQYLYHALGQPALEVSGEVASQVHRAELPDWVHVSDAEEASEIVGDAPSNAAAATRVLIKGGCDLLSVWHFIASTAPSSWHADFEVHYDTRSGATNLWPEHTEIVRLCSQKEILRVHRETLERIPWLDEATFDSAFLSGAHDVYIHSALQDYGCGMYRHRSGAFSLPVDYFGNDLTDPSNYDRMFSEAAKRYQLFKIDREFLEWFRGAFSFEGALPPARFSENLRWIAGQLPKGATLVVLNGAEVETATHVFPFDARQPDRHRAMNAALDSVAASLPNVVVVDVRKFVTNATDVVDRLFHYQRSVYYEIASEVRAIIERKMG